MNKIHYIYKITNLINNKIYIGKHSQSIRDKDVYFGSGVLLNKAILKYGKKNFKKDIIEFCTKETLSEKEIYWIQSYNSLSPNGYNLAKGGNGGNSTNNTHIYNNGVCEKFLKETDVIPEGFIKGALPHTEKARLKMSKQIKGKHIGKTPWNKGLNNTNKIVQENAKRAQETIIKSGILKGKNNPRAKKFLFISPEGERFEVFGAIKSFCNEHNFSYGLVKKYKDTGIIHQTKSTTLNGWEIRTLLENAVEESKNARIQHYFKLKEANLLTKRQKVISRLNIGEKRNA